jgi:succinate dehydrogenase hydrophobic anchor subunit
VQPAANERLARWDRLYEVTSVLPLGAFVLLHVLDYGRVLAGVEEIGARQRPSAFAVTAEAMVLWLPLLGHAVFSLAVWRRRSSAEPRSASVLTHRLAGVVTGVFLVDHFVRFRLPILRGLVHPSDSVVRLAAELSATRGGVPWVAAFHLVGVIAVAFHLALGLRRIVDRSERLKTSRAVHAGCVAAGVVAGGVGVLTIVRLATGA